MISEIVGNIFDKSINEKMTLNQQMSLNEMAQINLREQKGRNHFHEDAYYVYVKGEGLSAKYKFHHFHIKSVGNGWDIRMLMDGTFHSIKTRGKGMRNDNDAAPIERIAKEWVKEQNALEPDKTNGQVAEIEWVRNNG